MTKFTINETTKKIITKVIEPVYSNLFQVKINAKIPILLEEKYKDINIGFIEESVKSISVNDDYKLELDFYDYVLEDKSTFSQFFMEFYRMCNDNPFTFEIIQHDTEGTVLKRIKFPSCYLCYVIPFGNLNWSEHEPTTFVVRFRYNDIELCTGKLKD